VDFVTRGHRVGHASDGIRNPLALDAARASRCSLRHLPVNPPTHRPPMHLVMPVDGVTAMSWSWLRVQVWVWVWSGLGHCITQTIDTIHPSRPSQVNGQGRAGHAWPATKAGGEMTAGSGRDTCAADPRSATIRAAAAAMATGWAVRVVRLCDGHPTHPRSLVAD